MTVSNIICDEYIGSADWEAVYYFGPKKRRVHNKIQARFKLKDGKIISHLDEFNVHQWATQAMGHSGNGFLWVVDRVDGILQEEIESPNQWLVG